MRSSASPGFAFDLARKRQNRVCSVEKGNVMESGLLWRQVVTALAAREFLMSRSATCMPTTVRCSWCVTRASST